MIEISDVIFEGQNCLSITNGKISLQLSKDYGPRILGLHLPGGNNLLAVLPHAVIPVDGAQDYSLRGGHRLWYAPETPRATYLTDDEPVEIVQIQNGVEVIQPVDQPTKIQKSWQVFLDKAAARLVIDHRLSNRGLESFRLAPWGITMLKPGGLAMLPLNTDLEDRFGLQPNNHLVLWPYTDISSPHLFLNDRSIIVNGNQTEGALKVGSPNPVGWLAYALEGNLFVKRAAYQKGAEYYDRGASSQIYHNPSVVELETLGPIVNLSPGDSVIHQEIWEVYPDGNWPGEMGEIFNKYHSMPGK